MFSKLARQGTSVAKFAKPAQSFQRRHVVKSLKNVFFEGNATTEEVVNSFRVALGAKDDYVTKYPDQSFKDYEAKLKTELDRPLFWDASLTSTISELLGYSKSEIELAIASDHPNIVKPTKNPQDEEIDWDLTKKLYSQSKIKDQEFDNISKNFKRMRSFLAENSNIKPIDINWKEWEQKLDKESVAQVKKDLETISELFPRVDASKVVVLLDEYFEPIFNRMKDVLIEGLPELQSACATLEKESPLLRVDENGLPIVLMDSPEFLDEYYPEIRDQIIEEIELSYFEYEYLDERKAIKTNPEALLTFNSDWERREIEKSDEQFNSELVVEASITEEAKAFQQMFLEVTSIAKKNVELESEVSQLKAQLEAQLAEAAEEDKGSKTVTKKELSPEVEKILRKHLESTGTAVKDFPGIKKKQEQGETQKQETAATASN